MSIAPSGDSEILVSKAQRKGRKLTTSVVGLHHYGINLKDMAKIMSKKFACGVAVADDDKHGECIHVQGDIHTRFLDFVKSDLAKYGVKESKVRFEEIKKKKKSAQ